MKINKKLKKKGLKAISRGAILVAMVLVAIMLLSISPAVSADAVVDQIGSKNSVGTIDDVYLEAPNRANPLARDNKSLYPTIVNDIALLAANMISTSELRTNEHEVTREIYVLASAYTSRVQETDSTPFTTAWNTQVRHGTIAANFLPFGTKLMIPDYYGNEIFTVEDRMNPRYPNNVDIWFADLDDAREFGRRNIRIQILES